MTRAPMSVEGFIPIGATRIVQAAVKDIDGQPLTAEEKRMILKSIAWMTARQDWRCWAQKPGSPKRYHITPDPHIANRYTVQIAVNRRDRHGRPCHLRRHVIELSDTGPAVRQIGEDA